VRNNNGAVTGNRVRATLSAFFSWAMGEGLADTNPVIGTNRTEEKPRDRVLAPAELRAIWNALPDDHFGAIMKLLALPGQRAGEIAGLRWDEIKGKTIALPGERTKNHRPHTVPLSDAAAAIIAAQPRRAGTDGKPRYLIFGLGEGPFSGWSNAKEALDAAIAEVEGRALPHWTPHDLRRTMATYIGGGLPPVQFESLPEADKSVAKGLGVQPHVIESVLNHVSGFKAGVAGTYNRSTYEPEKRQALDLWADHLLAIVAGSQSNVTTLQRA